MNTETTEEIQAILTLLKNTLMKNEVSIGFLKESNELLFFDTKTYLKNGQFDGFKTSLEELVK